MRHPRLDPVDELENLARVVRINRARQARTSPNSPRASLPRNPPRESRKAPAQKSLPARSRCPTPHDRTPSARQNTRCRIPARQSARRPATAALPSFRFRDTAAPCSVAARPPPGPHRHPRRSPLPTFSLRVRSTIISTNRSATASSTITRLVAVHRCPLDPNAPVTTDSVASARSASRSTTTGFFPPISHWHFFICRAASE